MTAGRIAVASAIAAVLFVAVRIGGIVALAYVALYVAATLPGWPIGAVLFGRRHPFAWVAGALIGYGITAVALWVPIALHLTAPVAFLGSWALAATGAWALARRSPRSPAIVLPDWTTPATVTLCGVLLLVPLLAGVPYSRLGETDAQGNRRYRAYFTADFVWHEALTAELARFSSPPRNPYLAGRSLHYYWSYFLLPAAVTGAGPFRTSPPIEIYLATNALCTGVLFVGVIYLAAWCAVRRHGAAAAATMVTVLCASAEGLYAALDLLRRARPLDGLRQLNIDAITSWYFQGLTIDGLPRSIWYNPQHSLACALGLIALVIAGNSAAPMALVTSAGAGLSLGLAVIVSPFPGGGLTLIYATVVLWSALATPRALPRIVLAQAPAVALVVAALGWCVLNKTFEGAGSAVVLGLSERARTAPGLVMGLALGPVLILAIAGCFAAARLRFPPHTRPAVAGFAVALFLLFFVTLSVEPIWIGWRAGQILLVTCPGLIALAIVTLRENSGRAVTAAIVGACALIGFPTTAIDYYNAQDTSNVAMGAGFHWTVVISPGEQEALRWIERNTPADALVQMAPGPRGRETWSLIPSFARRRMAAGLPISLLRTPEYDERAARADAVFASGAAGEAARAARALRIDYLYVGQAERDAFGQALEPLDTRPDLFTPVFRNDAATVYQVR